MFENPVFIAATKEYNTFENAVAAPYIRKSFTSDTNTEGEIIIASCGFYRLFVNGEEITKGFLAPYISNPDDYVYYDKYRVSLCAGENVIGVILGNGFQNNPGGYIWDFDKAPFRSAPKTALELRYKNLRGETVIIASDASFKTYPSPIIADDYRFGETYDAALEIKGWNSPGFDDGAWANALIAESPKGELKLCTAEPIKKISEIAPVDIFKEGDGFVYDFGVSEAGVCRLHVSGSAGQRIEFQHCDILKDGKFHIDNIWFVRDLFERDKHIVHKDVYVCKGEKDETYTPSFTYHGFRYVKVTGITEAQATKDLLTYIVCHSALESRGGFYCSDITLNKLQEMTRRSDLSGFYYFPTDCPQREKNGWTADAALSCEQTTLNFAPEKSYREWLCNIRKAQTERGSLPGIVPTAGWGFEWGNGPAWDCVLFYLPYYTYIYRGETDMIKESAEAFVKYLKYLETRKDENGLLHIGLGDWCHVGFSDDTPPKAPLVVTDSVISMDIAKKAEFMFDAIGLTEQATYARKQFELYRKAIRDNLIDFSTLTVKGECQSCQAMCLYYNVFEENERTAAFEVLLKYIKEADDHIDLGVLGGRVIFHVLSDFGYSDLAYKMIARPDYPSYGNWIERGATTLWENFAPDSVNSTNHHFWGDISAWFIKVIAGINYNPDKNDIGSVRISPAFLSALDFAKGHYTSKYGEISSSWKRQGDCIRVNIRVPEGVTAKVLPSRGYAFEDKDSVKTFTGGEYEFKEKRI